MATLKEAKEAFFLKQQEAADKEGLSSKAFSIMVPRKVMTCFNLSVEWLNGFYTADIGVTPNQDFGESEYFKIGCEYARQHRWRVTKVNFLPLPGKKSSAVCLCT